MTGMSHDRRKRACIYQIDNGSNTDATVAWMLKEYASDDVIRRAADPEKLCRNIVTMRGSGRERDINMQAFEAALKDVRERDRAAERDQLNKANIKNAELNQKVIDLQDENRALERENVNHRILALTAGRPAETTEEAIPV